MILKKILIVLAIMVVTSFIGTTLLILGNLFP